MRRLARRLIGSKRVQVDATTRVTLDAPFTFRDTVFPAGHPVAHRYVFDGIRATYTYVVQRRWPETRWRRHFGHPLFAHGLLGPGPADEQVAPRWNQRPINSRSYARSDP